MTHERRNLEMLLVAVAGQIDWPEPSPQLEERVRSRIEADATDLRRRKSRRWIAAMVAASTLVLILVVFPTTRHAIGDLLTEAGVRIGVIDEIPTDTPTDLGLGDEATLAEAIEHVSFTLRLPDALGPPDGIHRDGENGVSMYWDGPIVLTQRSPSRIYAEKRLVADTDMIEVTIEGGLGLWIEGAPHEFTLVDGDGDPIEVTTRLAANVLLWQTAGIDHRLELTGDLDDAMAIVDSMNEGG
jgi:hypothetical protein